MCVHMCICMCVRVSMLDHAQDLAARSLRYTHMCTSCKSSQFEPVENRLPNSSYLEKACFNPHTHKNSHPH